MKKILFYLGVLTFIYSCGYVKDHDQSDPLVLNDGSKWKISKEMKPYLIQSEKLLNKFVSDGNVDYKILAQELDVQKLKLIKNCNMKGAAHDELHKWLVPYMVLIEDIKNANSEDEAILGVKEMQKSIISYHDYFE